MRRAIALARRGGLAVRPNPLVGAVVVKGRRVIGEGYHRRFGGDHAEIEALRKAGAGGRGATLYVNLEPCSSYGKTPPCVEEIVRRGMARVVIGCLDPNPLNHARAASYLRSRKIEVKVGVEEESSLRLNRDFFTWTEENRPYGVLKLAFSLDGKIATSAGRSRWISSTSSRRLVHRLRSRSDAVVVGLRTVIADDPALTVRYGFKHPGPWRVVLDSRAEIPASARLLNDTARGRTIVAVASGAPRSRVEKLKKKGVGCLVLPARRGRVSLRSLFRRLAARGMIRVMIEGGGETAASALSEGLVDEVHFFIAPLIIGGRNAPTAVGGEGIDSLKRGWRVEEMKVRRPGGDIYVTGSVARGK